MSAGTRVIGVEHTGLMVRDTEGLASWYTAVFDARELSRSGDKPPIIFLGFGAGSFLELIPGDVGNSKPSDHVHLCFSVVSLDAAVSDLLEGGIGLDRPVFTAYDASPAAFLRDPEGNLLQLVERASGLPRPQPYK